MKTSGTSLLEVVFALAIAAVISAGLANATENCGRILASIHLQHRALTAARNILEATIASRCAAPVPCPAGLSCSVITTPVYGATRVNVRINTSPSRNVPMADLTTVVAAIPACS